MSRGDRIRQNFMSELLKRQERAQPAPPEMPAALAACPFCGGNARLRDDGEPDMNATIPFCVVECEECRARGPKYSARDFLSNAIRPFAAIAWNQRREKK